MTQYVDNITLATEQCCNCGMAFAMTADFMNRRRKDRETFYCPAGHPQHYTGESEESKLRRELERKQQMLDAETQRAQRISDERAEIAKAHRKMRVRVMNGVCPCCNRTFQNLLRHMQTEHKEEINLRSLRHAFGMTQAAIAKEIGVNSSYVSSYETGGYVPEYAKRCIDVWVESQTARAADAGGKEGNP